MSKEEKISVILPTYNEKGNIVKLIKLIKKYLLNYEKEILVVDDSSPDGTSDEVSKHFYNDQEVKIVIRKENKGLANSILDGIKQSAYNLIAVMDTDFNHDPAELELMVKLIRYTDIVVGARFVYGGGMYSAMRYYLSFAYNIFMRLLLGTRLNDNLSGFFIIKRSKLEKLNLKEIFYGYGDYFFRLLFFAQLVKLKIIEVPVYYRKRVYGKSKTNVPKIFYNYTIQMFKLFFKHYNLIFRKRTTR